MPFDERLIDAGIALGNSDAVRIRLAELGFKPVLLLKGPHDVIEMRCDKGGRGMACTHVFHATPAEAIRDGCPHCAIENMCRDEIEEVDEAEIVKAIKKQHAAIKKNHEVARGRRYRGSDSYGVPKYMI